MKFKSPYIAFFIVCLLAGCLNVEGPVGREANFGPPPPKKYEDIVKENLKSYFFEEKGSVYTFAAQPVKAHIPRNRFIHREEYGWAVCGLVDRKESFRGYHSYSGPMPFFVLFKDGYVADKLIGSVPDPKAIAEDFTAEVIRDVCKGVE